MQRRTAHARRAGRAVERVEVPDIGCAETAIALD
jgi:hypothetical protein